jgi:formate dehydrogenase iron-sulfur subunit
MEFGAVYIQPDICNGCSYCVVSCPFGVVQRNEDDGRAFKCTFCSDRQRAGLKPACAQACPTESIKFGPLDELTKEAEVRLRELEASGVNDAVVYNPTHSSVGGIHALFLLRGDPRDYNLPPQPEVPTTYLRKGWKSAAIAAGSMIALTLLSFIGGRR